MKKTIEGNPRCAKVMLVDAERTSPELISYRLFIDAARQTTGFIAREEREGAPVWRPYIRSSTNSGYWNAGPMTCFIDGYDTEEAALAVLLDEASEVLWENR